MYVLLCMYSMYSTFATKAAHAKHVKLSHLHAIRLSFQRYLLQTVNYNVTGVSQQHYIVKQ